MFFFLPKQPIEKTHFFVFSKHFIFLSKTTKNIDYETTKTNFT